MTPRLSLAPVLAWLLALAACREAAEPRPVATLALRPAWGALLPDDSLQLTVSAVDNQGDTIRDPRLTWTTSSPAVATVTSGGRVHARGLGTATIVVSAGALTAQAVVVVATPVIVGAGDIAVCTLQGDEATAAILDTMGGVVFTMGDNAYPNGATGDFASCYAPTWGRHRTRTRPSPGNHDYHTAGAAAYFAYFGAMAGDSGLGYYSWDFAGWHLVALNSEVPMIPGSPQEQWLRQDLSAHPAACTLAYWHRPRFSSALHANTPASQPLWEALYDAGADVVVAGHDHVYERFAPQTPDGALDSARGIRQFTAGTGGASHYGFPTVLPNSEVRDSTSWGVLRLTLRPDGYDWRFISAAPGTFADSGTAACH